MEFILISSCLLGYPDRYDGKSKPYADQRIETWKAENRLVPFCPEAAGGLPVPRPPAEIIGDGGGLGVLEGRARVVTRTGEDVTRAFIRGAGRALALCRQHGIRIAVLTERSPSCGRRRIYDGCFQRKTISGTGVTTALLSQHRIRVFSQHDLAAVPAILPC